MPEDGTAVLQENEAVVAVVLTFKPVIQVAVWDWAVSESTKTTMIKKK